MPDDVDVSAPAAATDGALARAIASQPPGAATGAEAELYRRYAPRVLLYGLKHLRDRMAAQDLVQQVLLVTIERLRAGEMRNPDAVASFVLGTSRMMVASLRRTERRREALDQHLHYLAATVVPPAEDAPDLARLERCLQAMRQRERTVLILTFYVDKPSPEIAETLGLTAGAVRVIRHRALAQMRECLAGTRS